MTLAIYENSGDTVSYSIDNLYTNSLILSFDGRVGGTIEKELYVRNSNVLYNYESVQVVPYLYSGGLDLLGTIGTSGFMIKLKTGDTQPSIDEWNSITPGNTIDIPNITGIVTYNPFWIYVNVPRSVPVQHLNGAKLKIIATQVLV